MSIRAIDDEGFAFIEKEEGCVLHVYNDITFHPTIGFGSTRYEDGTPVKLSDPPITLQRAKELFLNTSTEYANAVHFLTVPVLNQHQFNALFSFCYNIGTTGFKKSTVLSLINQGITDNRLKAAFGLWDKSDGEVLEDLVHRREAEYELYIS